jgi:hypothetical protein
VTLGGCSDTSAATTVSINASPFTPANATNDGPVCSTDPTVTLTESLVDDVLGATYDWVCNDVSGTADSGREVTVVLDPVADADTLEEIDCTVTEFDAVSGCSAIDVTTVDVYTGNPAILNHPSNGEAVPGGPGCIVIFTVGSERGTTVQWQFSSDDGAVDPFTDLVDGGAFSQTTSGTMVVDTDAAPGSEAGFYRCEVCNPCGCTFSNSAELTEQGACAN